MTQNSYSYINLVLVDILNCYIGIIEFEISELDSYKEQKNFSNSSVCEEETVKCIDSKMKMLNSQECTSTIPNLLKHSCYRKCDHSLQIHRGKAANLSNSSRCQNNAPAKPITR